MNIWGLICLALCICFLLLSLVFGILKGKSTVLISGFNSFSKEEKAKYNEDKLSMDMRNSFFLWSIILFIGAIASVYINKFCGIVAIVIWVIIFLKDFYMDAKKGFEKYKK